MSENETRLWGDRLRRAVRLPARTVAISLVAGMMLVAGAPALAYAEGEGVSVPAASLQASPAAMSADAGDRQESPRSEVTSIEIAGTADQEQARKVLSMVNDARADAGVAPLAWSTDLESAALQRAVEISLLFSHTRPNGDRCFTAFPAGYGSAGENLAFGYADANAVNSGWMASPGHYANMVDPAMTSMAVAKFVSSDGTAWWVELFSDLGGTGMEGDPLTGPVTRSVDVLSDDLALSAEPQGIQELLGSKVQLEVQARYDGAASHGVTSLAHGSVAWESSNEEVATVDDDGLATLRGEGEAALTAVVAGKSLQVPVTVVGFSDVNELTPHEEDILWLASNGITTGWDNGDGTYRFAGAGTITRQDMAAFLRRFALLMGDEGAAYYEPTDEDKARFTDVTDHTPHAEDIWWLASTGITEGYQAEDGSSYFAGMSPVFRQDMAAFLRRIAVLEGIGRADSYRPTIEDEGSFSDVTAFTPHAEDIWWLASAGISTGWQDEDGTAHFSGMSEVVRQDMAAFLHRLYLSA